MRTLQVIAAATVLFPALLLTALLLNGAPATADQNPRPATQPDASSKLTQQDAEAFAEQLANAINARDGERINEVFDVDRLLVRTLDKVESKKDTKRGFVQGFKQSFNFGPVLCTNLGASGWAESLRVARMGNPKSTSAQSWAILLRIAYTAVAFDYYQFRLDAVDGQLRIVDAYYHSSGQSQSEILRSMFYQSAEIAEDDNALERASSWRDAMLDMHRFEQSGEPRAAIEALDQVVEMSGPTKFLHLKKIRLASQCADKELVKTATERFQREYPNDPALALLEYDLLVEAKDYTRAIASLRALRASFIADPYIDYAEGVLLAALGKPEAAKTALEKAVVDGFRHTGPYWQLVALAVNGKDFEEVARLLSYIRDDLQSALPEIESIPLYAEFIRSEAYRKWRAATTRPRKSGE